MILAIPIRGSLTAMVGLSRSSNRNVPLRVFLDTGILSSFALSFPNRRTREHHVNRPDIELVNKYLRALYNYVWPAVAKRCMP